MRTIIFFLFLLAVSAKAQQDCFTQQVIAYSRDLSGIMATAKKENGIKYLELYMFLPRKASFDKNNPIEMVLTDSTIVTGIFAESGKTKYNDAVGYHVLTIKVFFPDEYLFIMSRVPIARIKMRGNNEDVEMMGIGRENIFMQTILCIL